MSKYQSIKDIKLSKPSRKHSAKKQHSITKSSLFSIEQTLGLTDLFGGNMTHASFDCPTNLREAFKLECKHNGTSTCKELTKYMANYVATSRIEKHALGNTISRFMDPKFTIEEMIFNQNVQSRPRRYIANSNPAHAETIDGESFCEIGDCRRPAVEIMSYQPKKNAETVERRVCNYHATEFSKASVWRFKN